MSLSSFRRKLTYANVMSTLAMFFALSAGGAITYAAIDGESQRWYMDADSDGHGDWYNFLDSDAQPKGYVASRGDCIDSNASVHPGQVTDPGDGMDNDCDGFAEEDRVRTWYFNEDGDLWGLEASATRSVTRPTGDYNGRFGDWVLWPGDCNERTRPAWNPYRGCGSNYDIDGDGSRALRGPPAGYVGDDCDDFNQRAWPGQREHWYNGVDDDCSPQSTDVFLRKGNYLWPDDMVRAANGTPRWSGNANVSDADPVDPHN